jgi:hypothetical protein
LIDKQRGHELSGLSVRNLEYLFLTGAIETRKIGKRRLIVFRSLKRFLQQDHPPSEHLSPRKRQSVQPEGAPAAP